MDASGFAVASGASAAALLLSLLLLWRVAVRLRDVSIIDLFWGPGFVIVAAVTAVLGTGPLSRRLLLLGLTGAWGLRLGVYLWWRNHGTGEDPRYAAMRRKVGEGFDRYALVHVYLFQGVMLWIVSLPVQVGGFLRNPHALAAPAWLGLVVWAVGLAFETVGDIQLARFKAQPANAGQVMDRGLWSWTRHPNYFGDACVWWGIWLVVAIHWAGVATVVAPALMTYLLVNVTGKRLLERRMGRSRPGYDAYVARTSGFFPRPPRRQPA